MCGQLSRYRRTYMRRSRLGINSCRRNFGSPIFHSRDIRSDKISVQKFGLFSSRYLSRLMYAFEKITVRVTIKRILNYSRHTRPCRSHISLTFLIPRPRLDPFIFARDLPRIFPGKSRRYQINASRLRRTLKRSVT